MKSLCESCLYPNDGDCPAEWYDIEYKPNTNYKIVTQCDMFDDGKQDYSKYPEYFDASKQENKE